MSAETAYFLGKSLCELDEDAERGLELLREAVAGAGASVRRGERAGGSSLR